MMGSGEGPGGSLQLGFAASYNQIMESIKSGASHQQKQHTTH